MNYSLMIEATIEQANLTATLRYVSEALSRCYEYDVAVKKRPGLVTTKLLPSSQHAILIDFGNS